MRPTAGIPALTSRVSASLSFVLLTLPAAPGSHARSRAPCFSMVRVHSGAPVFILVAWGLLSSQFQYSSSVRSGAPVFSLVAQAFPGSRSQSAFPPVPVRESGPLPSAGGYGFPARKRGGSFPLPFIFRYLRAASQLATLYLNTQH